MKTCLTISDQALTLILESNSILETTLIEEFVKRWQSGQLPRLTVLQNEATKLYTIKI